MLGGLTLMMSPPLFSDGSEDPETVNELLNAAFATLHGMGEDTYRRFLQDDVDGPTTTTSTIDVTYIAKTAVPAHRPKKTDPSIT